MKKLFFLSVISGGILSWLFFLFLAVFTFSPWVLIKTIDDYFLPSYSIDFSELESTGKVLNRNLKFFNLNIFHNDKTLIKIKELDIGLSLKPQKFFYFLNINNIVIRDGYFDYSNIQNANSSPSFLLNFDEQISLSFKDFEYRRDDSILEINGDLFGELSKSFSGQLSFLHDNQLSTIAVDIVEESYRFSINLYSFKWLSLIPAFSASPIKDLEFQMNALGELQNDQSIVSGSFDSNSLFFRSLSLKPNKGSFYYQSRKNIGTLKLSEFLNPFVDEEHPIQINLQKKSIEVPRFFISPQIIEIEDFKVSNLIIENFFISFDSIIPKYSGFIKDLDLNDLYFDEIKNLSGNFSGNGNHMKFLVDSDTSILKNYKKDFIPVSIIGAGNFSSLAFDFNARILNQSSQIDLALQIDSELLNPLSLELKGYDVSKNLITFSLQKSLNGVSSYIDRSIDLLGKNSVYFNYSTNHSNLNPNLKIKIFSNESVLTANKDLIIDFSEPIIEADSKNLYVFSPSGKADNFSFAGAYGLLNYETAKINFYSLHDIASIELQSALDLGGVSINLPNIKAENKGEIQLSSLNLKNAISLKTKNFSMPVTESYKINFDNSSMFIVDLDKVYGLLPSSFMKDKISILLSGSGLTETYDLTLSTNVNLDLEQLIANSIYLQVSGNEFFKIDFNIKKNSPSILKMYSDLKHIKLNSPLNSLSKNKLVRLPTEILISNFLNPSIKLSNQKIDMHIRDISNYDGYISIGKKIPDQLKGFALEPGLNIYLYSEVINEDLLSSVFSRNSKSASIKLNKLAFDIKNFKFFNNNFSDVSGLFDLNGSEITGNIIGDKLNLNLRIDQTGFIRLEIKDSAISDTKFINSTQSTLDGPLNSRLIVSNSSFGKIKIKDLDVYLLNNNKNFTANNIKLSSNLISIKPLEKSSAAYFSIDKIKPLYKLRGEYLIKDSNKIPYLRDFADFSYFNGSINLQWRELSNLSHLEGGSAFVMKDLVIQDSFSDSLAFNLLGVLNLRNILGKLANLDLSIDEFTSTQLSRVEGDLLFSKSKLRLASPLYIETNAAKMKWVGQVNKNSNNKLEDLDLNLDLRIRFGENLPWYAAILGGLPAVAGSAVLNEVFEEDINNLTNYQYEILGTISEPKLERIK
jgi:hypothetical protein